MFKKINYFHAREIIAMEAEISGYDPDFLEFEIHTHCRAREAFSEALNKLNMPAADLEELEKIISRKAGFNKIKDIHKEYREHINALVAKRVTLEDLAEDECEDFDFENLRYEGDCQAGFARCATCEARYVLENQKFPTGFPKGRI